MPNSPILQCVLRNTYWVYNFTKYHFFAYFFVLLELKFCTTILVCVLECSSWTFSCTTLYPTPQPLHDCNGANCVPPLKKFMRKEYESLVGRPVEEVIQQIKTRWPRAVVRKKKPGQKLPRVKVGVLLMACLYLMVITHKLPTHLIEIACRDATNSPLPRCTAQYSCFIAVFSISNFIPPLLWHQVVHGRIAVLTTNEDGTIVTHKEEDSSKACFPKKARKLFGTAAAPLLTRERKNIKNALKRPPILIAPRKDGAPRNLPAVKSALIVSKPIHVDEGIDLSRLNSAVSHHMFTSSIGTPSPPRMLGIVSATWTSNAREKIETVFRCARVVVWVVAFGDICLCACEFIFHSMCACGYVHACVSSQAYVYVWDARVFPISMVMPAYMCSGVRSPDKKLWLAVGTKRMTKQFM